MACQGMAARRKGEGGRQCKIAGHAPTRRQLTGAQLHVFAHTTAARHIWAQQRCALVGKHQEHTSWWARRNSSTNSQAHHS